MGIHKSNESHHESEEDALDHQLGYDLGRMNAKMRKNGNESYGEP